MAKLESAAQFNELVKAGRYENKINAQRAAGRTRLSDSEKRKVFAFLESYYGSDGAAPHGAAASSKKPSKKTAKKAAKQARQTASAGAKNTGKKAGRKPAAAKSSPPPPGSIDMAPSEVKTVSDIIRIVDSTVSSNVSIINALKAANQISADGDISDGIKIAKDNLAGAARILNQSVVVPLSATASPNPEVAERLSQVVNAASKIPVIPEQLSPVPEGAPS